MSERVILIAFAALIIVLPVRGYIKSDYRELKKNIIFPVDYKYVPVKTKQVNNFLVNIPFDETYCWNSPIPCSLFQRNIGITDIEFRGEGLKDGFRPKK